MNSSKPEEQQSNKRALQCRERSPSIPKRNRVTETDYDDRKCPLMCLPTEIQEEIINQLDYREQIVLGATCNHFHRLVKSRVLTQWRTRVFCLSFNCDNHWDCCSADDKINIRYGEANMFTISTSHGKVKLDPKVFVNNCRRLVIQAFCECSNIPASIVNQFPVLDQLVFLDIDFFTHNRLENTAAEEFLIGHIDRFFPCLERLHLHFFDFDMFLLFERLIRLKSLRHLKLDTAAFNYEDDFKGYVRGNLLQLETILFKSIKLSNIRMFLDLFVDANELRDISIFQSKITLRREALELNALFSLDHIKNLQSLSTDLFQDYLQPHYSTQMFTNLLTHLDSLNLGIFIDILSKKTDEDFLFVTNRLREHPPKYYFKLSDFKRMFSGQPNCLFGHLSRLYITFGFVDIDVEKSRLYVTSIVKKFLDLLEQRQLESSNLKVLDFKFIYKRNFHKATVDDYFAVFSDPVILQSLNNFNHFIGNFSLTIYI